MQLSILNLKKMSFIESSECKKVERQNKLLQPPAERLTLTYPSFLTAVLGFEPVLAVTGKAQFVSEYRKRKFLENTNRIGSAKCDSKVTRG